MDWATTYLLGWYDSAGKSYLSSWMGSNPHVEAVVVGAGPYGPPLWNAPIPPGCRLIEIPSELASLEDKIAHATKLGGVYAFGWRMPEPINRQPK